MLEIMDPETLLPPTTYDTAKETEMFASTYSDDVTDTAPCEEDIDYETLRVFFGAGF